jgi:DNA-binding response OmpR family regulator
MNSSTPPLVILFAETDLASTRPLRVDLRRRGAAVHFVSSGADAVRQAQLEPPDLVVLDDGVDKEDGTGLLAHVQEHFPNTQVILLYSGGDGAPHGPGQGLLFSAHKPVSKESLLDVIVSAFPGRLGTEPVPRPASHTVLCVDDDGPYLNSLSRFLKRRGYKVFGYERAKEAIAMLPVIRPELAIVDIMMPGIDGIALTRRIHEDYKGNVPVVVLTALDSKEMYRRAKESGASYCLTKPCKPEDFLNVVDFIAGDLDAQERQLLKNRVLEPGRA